MATRSTSVRTFTLNQERIPVRSAVALVTAEMLEAFPPAGGRALEGAVSMEVATAVVGITKQSRVSAYGIYQELRMEKNIMLKRISNFVQGNCKKVARIAMAVVVALSLGGSFAPIFAEEACQQTFASAQDAAHALFVAMQSADE